MKTAGNNSGPPSRRIRARVICLLALLIPAVAFPLTLAVWRIGGSYPNDALIGSAVAALTGLALLAFALKRLVKRQTLTAGEVAAVYLVTATVAGICASPWAWGGHLASMIAYPVAAASPGNRWAQDLLPYLPRGLVVTDPDALTGLLTGESSPYRWNVMAAWAQPALWWVAWSASFAWTTLCLNVIVWRRWSREEKLPFPLATVPVALSDPERRLIGRPGWWVGLAISIGIGALNVLHGFMPGLPTVSTTVDISTYLNNNHPWDAIRTPALSWDPWYVGIAYLMNVDLAFSLILFNLFWRLEYVGSRLGGWTVSAWAGFPYGDEQAAGGYLALACVIVWLDRRYLMQVARRALGMPSSVDDHGEALSYRTAVFGGVLGVVFLWWFSLRAGMPSPVAAGSAATLVVVLLVMLRIRAQLGPPSHSMFRTTPNVLLEHFPGTRGVGPEGIALLGLQLPFLFQLETSPASMQMDALRISEQRLLEPRQITRILLFAVPAAVLCCLLANLHFGYMYGMDGKAHRGVGYVSQAWTEGIVSSLRNPRGPDWTGTGAIGVGALLTFLLMYLKLRLPWWPLHPIAFPLAFWYIIDMVMPAVVIAWCAKVLLLRYGGPRAHQRALPFFIGLIAGSSLASLGSGLVAVLLD